MAKKVFLHTQLSTFSTYHSQGAMGVFIMQNPSIYNWLLNNTISIECSKRFLSGFTSPEVIIPKSTIYDVPYVDSLWMPCKFFEGHVHGIIRNILDRGYYVGFSHIDDYYIPGKTWYKEKHFTHDGLICGYDQEEKTYSLFAYDKNWVYRVFEIPQASLGKGIQSGIKLGYTTNITALKAKPEKVLLEPKTILNNIKTYLEQNIESNPVEKNCKVFGTAVHNYIEMYLDILYKGTFEHQYTDQRIFRFIWEHKKCMYDRIKAIEEFYNLEYVLSDEYKSVVLLADKARLLYAIYTKTARKDLLISIKDSLHTLHSKETEILNKFIDLIERNI